MRNRSLSHYAADRQSGSRCTTKARGASPAAARVPRSVQLVASPDRRAEDSDFTGHRAGPARVRRFRQATRSRRLSSRQERREIVDRDPRRARRSTRRTSSVTTGARAWPGRSRCSVAGAAGAASRCCRSGTRAVPQAHRAAREVLVHGCVPARRGRGDPAPRRLGAAAASGRHARRADRVIADLERPATLTAGLNWYRANRHPRDELQPPSLRVTGAPTLGSGAAATPTCSRRRRDRLAPSSWRTTGATSAWTARATGCSSTSRTRSANADKKPSVLMSAISLRAAFAARDLSPVEVIDAFEELPEYGAFITLTLERAREEAQAAERAYKDGTARPLEGLTLARQGPVRHRRRPHDLRLEHLPRPRAGQRRRGRRRRTRAGAIVVGKTLTHEFAWGITSVNPHFPPCRNPHDPERVAGGTSGGSAVALGARTGPRARHRHRRLDPHPGRVLRRVRPEADVRPSTSAASTRSPARSTRRADGAHARPT